MFNPSDDSLLEEEEVDKWPVLTHVSSFAVVQLVVPVFVVVVVRVLRRLWWYGG